MRTSVRTFGLTIWLSLIVIHSHSYAGPGPVLTGDPLHDHEIIKSARSPEEAIAMLPDDEDLVADIVADWLGRDMDSRSFDPSQRGITEIITVGDDNACDFSSPRAAAFAAAGPPAVTLIRIATNREYSGTATRIRIENKDVILAGGYTNCSATTATDGRTTIDTTGGRNRPVVRIRNTNENRVMQVELRRLTLQGGTTTTSSSNCSESDRNGAGVNIRGRIHAELTDTVVRNNETTSGTGGLCSGILPGSNRGGGIFFDGEHTSDNLLQLNAGSAVLNNRTGGTSDHLLPHGGGIYCQAGANVILADAEVAIALNRAGTSDENNIGAGGGIFTALGCMVLSRAGGTFQGIFQNRSDSTGGGVNVASHEALILEPAADGIRPVIVSNIATSDGGGIFSNVSPVELVDTNLSGNFAHGRGGGIYLRSLTTSANGVLTVRRSGQPCAGVSIEGCSVLANNGAEGHGGALYITNGQASISQTTISGNTSGGLGSVALVRGPGAELLMESVAIHGNERSSRLFQLENQSLTGIDWSTIAGNRNPDDPSLQVFRLLNSDGNPQRTRLRVRGSIVWEPAATMVNRTGPTFAPASCVIGHTSLNNSGFSSGSLFYSLIDPRLQDPAGGNLRLQGNSPAIDYCSTGNAQIAPSSVDLFGNPRPVTYDGSTLTPPNPGDGNVDLGVHEVPRIDPPLADLSITKTVSPEEAEIGSDVTFTITVENLGPDDATGVTGNDALPDGYTFVAANLTPEGSYSAGSGAWSIPDLDVGGEASLILRATVNPEGDYVNVATVESDEDDPNPGNNSAEAAVIAIQPAENEVFEDRFEN